MTLAANERTLPTDLLPVVHAVVAKLNKRAAKIGVEPFVLTVGTPFLREKARTFAHDNTVLETYTQEVVTIAITGAAIKVAGHELIGRVDFEGGLTIVNTRPGGAMPEAYRTATPLCQHCNSMRKRNAVFVFQQESGAHIQVGRTCLQDFLGHSPEKALWAAREWDGVFGEIDEECERGGGHSAPVVAPLTALAAAARSVRELGFISKAAAQERECGSTADDVSSILFDRKTEAKRWPTDEDFATGAVVLAWVKETFAAKTNLSDYEHNALALCGAVAVGARRVGLLASLIGCYHRAMEEKVVKQAAVNAHVGTIGERRDFEAVYRGETAIDTQYGTLYIGRFQSDAGLLVYKGASPFWRSDIQIGDAVKFKATVKDHDDYKGTLQTMVARCKLAA